jgi:hypothetical protein
VFNSNSLKGTDMNKIMLFVCSVLSLSLNAGVSVDTVIETSNGPKEIGLVKVGDKLLCFNNNLSTEERSVISIEEIETNKVVEITTKDDVTISVAAEQMLFVPMKWVRADQLSLGDVLFKKDHTLMGIKSICHKDEPTKLRFIIVDENHNFFASKNGIIIHNGVWGAWLGFGAGYYGVHTAFNTFHTALGSALTAVGGPVGTGVACTISGALYPVQVAAAKSAGIACGIWLGTVTGPV